MWRTYSPRNKLGCDVPNMTVRNNYNNLAHKSLLRHRSPVSNINADSREQEQLFSYPFDQRGFAPCACKSVVGTCDIDYWIVDNQGEV
jgi:hypothetical protein